jgi:ABC-type branched-subunit amino acid transport system substrate-binding protein
MLKRGVAFVCGAGLLLAACSSSKTTANSHTGNTQSTTGQSGQSGATIPPPAKVTGTLSGPGVTPTTITIGQIATITGPVPGLFQGADDGLDAWANWVNTNGGLDGRQIKIDHVDDGFNCTTYTNAMKQFATNAFAVLGNLTLEDTCGKSVLAANPNLVDIQALALDPTLYSVPNVYTASPTPPGGITTGLEYIKSKFPNDITHAAALVGESAKANGKEEQLTAASIGYHYVYTRNIGDFETNYTSDILRMKNDGVKFVDMTDVAVTNTADFLQQAAQQNFKPDVVYGASAYDAKFFKLVGNASLANGILYSAVPESLYLGQDRATVPAVNTFLTSLQNAHPGASADLYAVDAWGAGQLLIKAMQGAGSNITQASVAEAIKSVNNFNADGLMGVSNPGQKQGTHCVVVAGVVNGQWQRIDPASSGFDCSGVYHDVPLSQVSS